MILEKYLNVVEFGEGIYGVKAAAHHYFQSSPSELNPLESAYLAFLLPNPKGYSKGFRTENTHALRVEKYQRDSQAYAVLRENLA